MKFAVPFLSLAVLLLCPMAARAVIIRNTTTNTILFSDNFEAAPNGVSSVPAPDLANFHNPVADLGSYFIAQPDGAALQVTDSTLSPDPGPAQGINYLRDYRLGADGSNNQGYGLVPTAAQTTFGENVRLSMMVNVGANSSAFFAPSITTPNGTLTGAFAYIIARSAAAGGTGFVGNYNGVSTINTSVPFLEGVWQRWDLDFTVGSNLYDLTVAGNTQTGIVGFGTGGNFAGVEFFNGSGLGGSFYLDALPPPVPEPSTLALLGLGAIGLAIRTRRRRTAA